MAKRKQPVMIASNKQSAPYGPPRATKRKAKARKAPR